MDYIVDIVKNDPVNTKAVVSKGAADVTKNGRQYTFSYPDIKGATPKVYAFSDDLQTVTEIYQGKSAAVVFVSPIKADYAGMIIPASFADAMAFEIKLDDILITALITQGYGKLEKF